MRIAFSLTWNRGTNTQHGSQVQSIMTFCGRLRKSPVEALCGSQPVEAPCGRRLFVEVAFLVVVFYVEAFLVEVAFLVAVFYDSLEVF